MMTGAAIALATAGFMGLGTLYVRDQRRERSGRRAAFAACRGVLEDEALSFEDNHYPVLRGRFAGDAAELRLIVDTIHLRKLPVLWLSVTLRRALPVSGVLDIMARASNNEFYSSFADLPQEIRIPETWPDALRIRTRESGDATMAELLRLEPEILHYFADDRAKELMVTAKGVRLVYRVSESDRGHYLLTRLPKFNTDALTAATVQGLLERAAQIGTVMETTS